MQFNKEYIKDLQAGIVVFLVALPLCLGIALAQNAPPISGLISGIIGGTIVMLISGAKFSISGPAAGLTAIVIVAIKDLGGFDIFVCALFIAGLIQILFGVSKLGVIGHYFPSSVIKGMLSAIGIILLIKQIPHLVGYDADPEGDLTFFQMDGENTFSELFHMVNYITPGATIIGIVSLIILILWNKAYIKNHPFISLIPGALMVVFLGVGLNEVFKEYFPSLIVQPSHLVYLPEIRNYTDLVNGLHFPDFNALYNIKTYWVAFTIALVASLETLLNIDATDKLKKVVKPSPANRELIAQGVGNFTCGLLGGIPITSVIVRSSANIHAGAKTKLSGLTHGVLLLLSVLLFPGMLNLIPYASLSAVLLITGYKLTQVGLFKDMYALGWKQFLPFIVTVVIMLLTGILKGIFCGLLVAVYFIIRDMMRIPIKRSSSVIDGKIHTLITFPENVTFVNKGVIYNMLQKTPENSILILDGTFIKSIDYDVLETITRFKQSAFEKHIEVQIINIQLINLQLTSH